MRIWKISDTHAMHATLNIPPDIDCIIHGGDSTNYFNWVNNQPEFEDFFNWFVSLPVKYKILIAGNHDAWATKKYNIDRLREAGIIYLEHEYYSLKGLLLFGSPYTPTFGNWHFMKARDKLSRTWECLVPNIDILITHGPPKGILDLSHDKNNKLEYCGDSALFKAVLSTQPKHHMFGHIHDSKGCYNSGNRTYQGIKTIFHNVSCVEDGQFGKGCTSHGQIINL